MKWVLVCFFLISCSAREPEPVTRVYLSTANTIVGFHERTNRYTLQEILGVDPVKYEWCAAFVNFMLIQHSIPGSDSVSDTPLVARSFLQWGHAVDVPKRGDIVVLARGRRGWQGHVGFYHSTVVENGVEYYMLLGGNQDDSVSYAKFPASAVVGIRRWEL